MYRCSKAAVSAQQQQSGSGEVECGEHIRESSLSSWAHHSNPQMNAAAAGITPPTCTDHRRLQQLRVDDDKDAMHRFK